MPRDIHGSTPRPPAGTSRARDVRIPRIVDFTGFPAHDATAHGTSTCLAPGFRQVCAPAHRSPDGYFVMAEAASGSRSCTLHTAAVRVRDGAPARRPVPAGSAPWLHRNGRTRSVRNPPHSNRRRRAPVAARAVDPGAGRCRRPAQDVSPPGWQAGVPPPTGSRRSPVGHCRSRPAPAVTRMPAAPTADNPAVPGARARPGGKHARQHITRPHCAGLRNR